MALDPIDQAVISQALIAAAREMGVKQVRSAYSPIVREISDCSAALMDREGNVVAQAELIAMQLGTMRTTFAACAELYPPEELEEGDFYINNDPYNGGQHVPDVFIYSPIFFEGRLIGFAASIAHHLDLGGGAPGLNPEATDVYQEGIIFLPSKYNLARDWNGGPFERFVRANIRVPAQTIGDFNAQFAANAMGARRLRDLTAKFGPEVVMEAMQGLMDYSETRIRAAIAEAPDGTYEGEDFLDDDGLSATPVPIRAQVEITGDSIRVGFEGTAAQVKSNLNCPLTSTTAAALTAVKAVLTSADIPFNEGAKRAIQVSAPEGSLLNPRHPAPVRARMLASYRIFNAVMKALAAAVPEKAIASGFDTTDAVCLSHLGEDGYRIYLEIFGGGYGASARRDGADAVSGPLSNCANVPIEALDMEFDYFRTEASGLRTDSGGRGNTRGGYGSYRKYLILKDDVSFSTYAERFRVAPEGLFGGEPGGKARNSLVRDGERRALAAKGSVGLRTGDLLTIETGGGAGYGVPLDDPDSSNCE